MKSGLRLSFLNSLLVEFLLLPIVSENMIGSYSTTIRDTYGVPRKCVFANENPNGSSEVNFSIRRVSEIWEVIYWKFDVIYFIFMLLQRVGYDTINLPMHSSTKQNYVTKLDMIIQFCAYFVIERLTLRHLCSQNVYRLLSAQIRNFLN